MPLGHWLRLLWNCRPGLHLHGEVPFIAAGELHLPWHPDWQDHRAAAAHAAAHLVYSPPRFEADRLVPLARALLALLEDARVESLAMRELPGLARLWRPLHRATPDDGQGSAALLARLARALADPAYVDAHPWVAKGRRLFYLDEALALPALRTADELREAALRLGHDLGQMRLPFNAQGYRPEPAYRDDHRWMWAADQLAAATPPPRPEPTPASAPPDVLPPEQVPPDSPEHVALYPEWDRLIRRLRPNWCRVSERPPAATPAPPPVAPGPWADGSAQRAQALRAPLRRLARPLARRGRHTEGELFDLDALVDWRCTRASGQTALARVFVARQRQATPVRVWLLLDRSASTAAAWAGGPGDEAAASVWQASVRATAATALALRGLKLPCAVAAFNANGRHAVQVVLVQPMGRAFGPAMGPVVQPRSTPSTPIAAGGSSAGPAGQGADASSASSPGDALWARLQALRPAGSTRLGAALRHATARLGGDGREGQRWVLLVSDGQPHDVDVHDGRYLVDDARHAVRQAHRRGVRMGCLCVGPTASPEAVQIFGRRGAQALPSLAQLPQALQRLLA